MVQRGEVLISIIILMLVVILGSFWVITKVSKKTKRHPGQNVSPAGLGCGPIKIEAFRAEFTKMAY